MAGKYKIDKKGLVFSEGYKFPDWEEAGHVVTGIGESAPFAIGDWLCAGEFKFGEMYSQALEVTGFSKDKLAHYKWVSGKVPRELRVPDKLSYGHHRLVAPLTHELQKKYLDYAIENNVPYDAFQDFLRNKIGVAKYYCSNHHQFHTSAVKRRKVWVCEESINYNAYKKEKI